MAWFFSVKTAISNVAGRLRAWVKSSHRTLEREFQHVLDESESPSCCVHDTAEGVRNLARSAPGDPDSRDRESRST